MIDPHQTERWRTHRTTELYLNEERLTSVGISVRVMLSAIFDPDLIWYSAVYGEHDDNLYAIAAKDPPDTKEFCEIYEPPGPLTQAVSDLFAIREFGLGDDVAAHFGLFYSLDDDEWYSFDGRDPYTSLPSGVQYLLTSHDNTYSSILPPSRAVVERVIQQVLELHSFYMHQNVDWGSVSHEITSLLWQYKGVRLRSDWTREKHVVRVGLLTRPERLDSWRPGRAFTEEGLVEFGTGKAVLKMMSDPRTP